MAREAGYGKNTSGVAVGSILKTRTKKLQLLLLLQAIAARASVLVHDTELVDIPEVVVGNVSLPASQPFMLAVPVQWPPTQRIDDGQWLRRHDQETLAAHMPTYKYPSKITRTSELTALLVLPGYSWSCMKHSSNDQKPEQRRLGRNNKLLELGRLPRASPSVVFTR